jgi:hypothetical protein
MPRLYHPISRVKVSVGNVTHFGNLTGVLTTGTTK